MAKKILTGLDLNGPLTISGSGGTNNYYLKTDGSGNISWAVPTLTGGSTLNSLTVGTSGLRMTTGSSPWNGSAAATIDIDTSKVPLLTAIQTFTGQQTIQTSASGNKGLIVKGSASQSVSLQEWQTSGGTIVARVNGNGVITTNAILGTATTVGTTITTVTPATPSSGYVTYTTAAAHGLVPGQTVTIGSLNANYTATNIRIFNTPTSTTFSVPNSNNVGTSTGQSGTITTSILNIGGDSTTVIINNSEMTPYAMSSGIVSFNPTANTPSSVSVTFPVNRFTLTPIVQVTAVTAVIGSTVQGVAVSSQSSTGFTAWVYRTNTSSTTVNWQATQMSIWDGAG